MSDDVVYFDTETNIKNVGEDAIGKNKASPFCEDNEAVYTGVIIPSGVYSVYDQACPWVIKGSVYVAQNISFDLLHHMNDSCAAISGEWREAVQKSEIKIWDTMLVEYLLTGQRLTWASLDTLADLYGGELKDSRIKEYWDNGIDTEDIPPEEILPYLETDVRNLEIIYKGQRELAEKMGMLPLIESQMEARLATIWMEHNGMQFDKQLAMSYAKELQEELDKLTTKQCDLMWRAFRIEGTETLVKKKYINPNSNEHISVYMFGGKFPTKQPIPQYNPDGSPLCYKSGKRKGEQKTKLETVYVEHTFGGEFEAFQPPNAKGFYPVGVDVLRHYADHSEFCQNALKIRELTKQINTYFKGYSALTWPDGKIHGQLNHCQTATGRLSSSQPNLQNLSNKKSGGEQ